jgi:hypothetical protein
MSGAACRMLEAKIDTCPDRPKKLVTSRSIDDHFDVVIAGAIGMGRTGAAPRCASRTGATCSRS